MNPSTEDFVKAVEELNARNIIISAKQQEYLNGCSICSRSDWSTCSSCWDQDHPSGLTSLLAFDESKSIEENYERMSASLGDVVSGSVTTAVRDTTIDGLEIHENDNLGMVDGKIVVSNPDMMETLEETFAHMLDEDRKCDHSMSVKTAVKTWQMNLLNPLLRSMRDVEVEIHQGGQPVYPYLFSVE